MLMAGDFRKGVTVEIDGQVWSIADFQHVKPGKGAAFVRTRLKNVMTGPTSSYISVAHSTTVVMRSLYMGSFAAQIWAIPIATPACGSSARPRYFFIFSSA